MASGHKVLIGANDFLLSYSPLDWRVLSSGDRIFSPLALCSMRFHSNPVVFKHFLPQCREGSALSMTVQCTHTRNTFSELHRDTYSCIPFLLLLLLCLVSTGQDHLIIFVTCKWIDNCVLKSTNQTYTWTSHPPLIFCDVFIAFQVLLFHLENFTFVNYLKII